MSHFTTEAMPVGGWFEQTGPNSAMQLQQPFIYRTGFGPATYYPMGTLTVDGQPNIPDAFNSNPRLAEGYEFFREIKRLGAMPGDLTLNVLLSKAETSADLGPVAKDASYERLIAESSLSVYGLAGSVVRRQKSRERAAQGGWPYQQTYIDRIYDAASTVQNPSTGEVIDVVCCDPSGMSGTRDVDALLGQVRGSVERLAEEEGTDNPAAIFADMVHLDALQWYQVARIGSACASAWRAVQYHAIGDVSITLPEEQLAVLHKLNALQVPRINFEYATPASNPDNNAVLNAYGLVIHDGVVPAELLED